MIERARVKDAKKVADFLRKTFEEDTASGGDASLQTKDALEHRCEVKDMWVCTEGGKVLGVLEGNSGGTLLFEGQKKPFTTNHFDNLTVDYGLYTTSLNDAVRIAGELTKGAADDLRDHGGMGDLIVVTGPKNSRGAHWCRLLKFSEEPHGNWSMFFLPFNLIWDRVDEAVL